MKENIKLIENKKYSSERSLYASSYIILKNCSFDGPEDGESALKESNNITIETCLFALRYPLWHVNNLVLNKSKMTNDCRAAIWYSKNINIKNSQLNGIKALRECVNISFVNSTANSQEIFWKCNEIKVSDSKITAEYGFFESKNISMNNSKFNGKYSFQYTRNVVFRNCIFDTKDAFWHSKNVIIYDSIIKGEYLGWYSKKLKLINCRVIGTQPLCYAEKLKLINCTFENSDLAFEYSSVYATIKGSIISIKNPIKGKIIVDKVESIILDDSKYKNKTKIIVKEGKKYENK